jgi:superfamily II DNA or RNA helicase
MAVRLEEITRGTLVGGILPNQTVEVFDVKWHGGNVLEVVYKDAAGKPGSELLYRDQENALALAAPGAQWSFTGEADKFRLVFEALRIRMAYLFDPLLAVHSSQVIPLPHQITAVYQEMLTRQPLRFLLADDPGAGKTVMTGLFIKELMARGDLRRCLIVSPGSLVEQWQDELSRKFDLPFSILTNDAVEAARTGNWMAEQNLVVARLDKLSRDEDLQAKLQATDWDLIVVDEAHKMSASFFGSEVKYTKRYRLGQMLSHVTRNFLLLTATPHNGKEADFQLFLALLDGDRFEGRFRDGVHQADTSDLMRRMVKEKLLKFDGTPLFPERIAYTVSYALSEAEAGLYAAVSDYVRDEFNRADNLESGRGKGNVGFALTSLQRRLASSPEAIYQSLRRRRERLEKRLREEELSQRGEAAKLRLAEVAGVDLADEEDLDDAPDAEREETEARLIDEASAAQTIAELRAEIAILTRLEMMALAVRNSGADRKWEELSNLLLNNREMFDGDGTRRKLVLFTEHRDTLNYLAEQIRNALGQAEAVVCIHGGIGREERRNTQAAFTDDPRVIVLIATDAAGEGINLQRAHLMVNYDLPWNPNRLEQRFGRIHRIGQTEVCHLWNLVAGETREGDVYRRLLEKLEEERKALGGQVFDVLGDLVFGDEPLWKLLLEAVRYGNRPDVRAKLFAKVEGALDRKQLQGLLEQRALVEDAMDLSLVRKVREDMERAAARKLQPHFVEGFFLDAFRLLGGTIRPREAKRYEITHVPVTLRRRDREIGAGDAVLSRYERVTFEREGVQVQGKPPAALICPGHPLLDATISLIGEQYRELLKKGVVLVDEQDEGEEPRLLFALEHEIRDARVLKDGSRRVISRRMQFVERVRDGAMRAAGFAPYLNYRPVEAGEEAFVAPLLDEDWLKSDIEPQTVSYAVETLVPEHYDEVRLRREAQIDKTRAAVYHRLTTEINYWDNRAEELRLKEEAGAQPKLNSEMARRRRDELMARLSRRMAELDEERRISRTPPVVIGGALIVPMGYLRKQGGKETVAALFARETARVERAAMDAVMAAERALGFEPKDVSAAKVGYDIESKAPNEGRLRFIEVKGRVKGAQTVTVTKNEINTALNTPEEFILALVSVDGEDTTVRYVRQPFAREPDFAVASVNYELGDLLTRSEEPA